MDVAEPRFGPDLARFRWALRDLERRLASAVMQVCV